MAFPHSNGASRAHKTSVMQRQLGNACVSRMLQGPQAKIPVGQPGDKYEQEADDVANRIVSGQKIARISRIVLGGQAIPIERQEEEEEPEQEQMQSMPVQRQPEDEELMQGMPLQRQPEDEKLLQGLPVQRQLEDEEMMQGLPVQRQAEDEELMQGMPVQRQPEDEELMQGMPVQRQPEDEELMQGMPVQRQEEDEELMQGLPLQRQPEDEELMQGMRLQRQPEDEELMQGMPVQRQPEDEEMLQGLSVQRQPEEEEEDEEPVQMLPIQRQAEELPETDIGEEPWPEPSDTEMQVAETVQAQDAGGESETVQDSGIESRLSSPDGGRPLSDGTKSKMESGMGMDFSGVRVHDNAQDQDDAKNLGAKAFAYGNHVWLGKGASENDNKLMAHELTHVVQQGAAVQKIPEEKEKTPKPAPANVAPTIHRSSKKVQRAGGILGKVAEFARNIPGYHLLSVIIGRDPISSEPVPRTTANVIKGVISLIPGGNLLYENLNKTGAIDKAGAWLDAQIEKLGFTWAYIKGLFSESWDALAWYDLALPWRAFGKIKKVFTVPVKRLFNFAKSIGSKILEFIFEGAMALAGGFGKQVLGFLKKAGSFFLSIIKDPIGFIGNLVKALAKGFGQFSANIWSHLKAGLMGWLFGALAGSGLQLPETFDLKGILSLVMQILGVTYQAVRKRLVKVIGEKRMTKVEKTVSFVADLITRGPIAAWEMITSAIGNLKDMVLGAIQNWVVTKIVKSAVLKLVSMFNPAGAIIQAAIAIYNTVMFFIERAQQIAELVQSIVSSIGRIAAGAVGAAANFIEQTMGKTLPVIISFLARLLGLGGIGEKIRGIIKKIQKPIAKGIDKVVKFVVGKVKKLFGKGKGKEKVKGGPTEQQHGKFGKEAIKELSKPPAKTLDYKQLRSEKQKQANELEEKYNRKLEKPVKMKITFSSPEKDKQDNDLDFHVQIAPNNSDHDGAIPLGATGDRPIKTLRSVSHYSGNPVSVMPLTEIRSGNPSAIDIPGWDHAQKLNAASGADKHGVVGRKGSWVKGHKIHHELNGDGGNPKNVFIIDKAANGVMISSAEGDAKTKLNELIGLTEPDNPNYNKVMYYRVQSSSWGTTLPLSAFANEITISYGTVNPDGSDEVEIDSIPVESSKPSESTETITVDLNGLGGENIYSYLKSKGIKSSFTRYLASILRKGRIDSVSVLSRKLQDENNIAEYNQSPPQISTDFIEKQTDVLLANINPNMTFNI